MNTGMSSGICFLSSSLLQGPDPARLDGTLLGASAVAEQQPPRVEAFFRAWTGGDPGSEWVGFCLHTDGELPSVEEKKRDLS